MLAGKRLAALALIAGTATLGGCTTISDYHGYIGDSTLTNAIQPGIDNVTSVEGTLGRPSFTSQFGPPVWYYLNNTTDQRPFGRPKIEDLNVLAIRFDANGNVVSAERTGMERVAYVRPNGDKTPTLGRQRGFFEDIFGNIGAVGSGAPGGGGRAPGP